VRPDVPARSRASAWEFRDVVLPRGVTKTAAKDLLVEQAERGQWELARMRLMVDGRRVVRLRRRVIRIQRTG
jgi:hypothetical protein